MLMCGKTFVIIFIPKSKKDGRMCRFKKITFEYFYKIFKGKSDYKL